MYFDKKLFSIFTSLLQQKHSPMSNSDLRLASIELVV